jgi:hypothetical protein
MPLGIWPVRRKRSSVFLTLVQFNKGKRVFKRKNHLLEVHTVLLKVGSSLGAIPFELIRHNSNGNQ